MATLAGKLSWLWGDTKPPGYPLGIFNCSAATTPFSPLEKFQPPLALPFTYFRDEHGNPRGVTEIPGDGPSWLSGMISLPGDHLVATYSKIKGFLEEYEVGLCVWDDAARKFLPENQILYCLDLDDPRLPFRIPGDTPKPGSP